MHDEHFISNLSARIAFWGCSRKARLVNGKIIIAVTFNTCQWLKSWTFIDQTFSVPLNSNKARKKGFFLFYFYSQYRIDSSQYICINNNNIQKYTNQPMHRNRRLLELCY